MTILPVRCICEPAFPEKQHVKWDLISNRIRNPAVVGEFATIEDIRKVEFWVGY